MSAEELLKTIRELPADEKEKVMLGLMKDFNEEMTKNPKFMHSATEVMHQFMGKRREKGEDVSELESISE